MRVILVSNALGVVVKMDKEKDRGPGVKIPPPLLLLTFILLGYGVQYFWPQTFLPEFLRFPLGFVFIFLGFIIPTLCLLKFKEEKTNVEPWKPARKLITNGIYQYTRNPIYLGLLIIGMGISITINSLWMILSLLPFIFLLHVLVIQKEENYLEKTFRNEYLEYKNKVRRWL